MFVQCEKPSCHTERPVLATHNDLKVVADDLNKIRPYKTFIKGVSPIRKEFDTSPPTTFSIRKEEMLHTLARVGRNFNNIDVLSRKLDHLVDSNQFFKLQFQKVRRITSSRFLWHPINLLCMR